MVVIIVMASITNLLGRNIIVRLGFATRDIVLDTKKTQVAIYYLMLYQPQIMCPMYYLIVQIFLMFHQTFYN